MPVLFSARDVRTQEPNASCRFSLWHQGATHWEPSLRPVSLAARHVALLAVKLALEDKVSGKICPEFFPPLLLIQANQFRVLQKKPEKVISGYWMLDS